MKHFHTRYALILFLLCLAATLTACAPITPANGTEQIVGSRKLVNQGYDLSDFDSIYAGSNFKLNVHQGDKFAVSATADDNVMPLVVVEKVGGELRLGVKPGSHSFRNVTMTAEVTLPTLKSMRLDSNATAHLDPFKSPSLTIHTTSNGMVDGALEVSKLVVDGGGNAEARLTGTADELTVKGQGNAILTLDGLTSKTAYVDMGSNAKAGVHATEELDYLLGGNAGLTYTGGARLGEQTTGGNAWARQR